MPVSRMDKIDELVKNELSKEVREIFPDFIISITQVHVTKDLSYAKIWVSALDKTAEAAKLCQRESKEIRKTLAARIELRKFPQLHFVPDFTEEEASKIDRLIEETKKQDKK